MFRRIWERVAKLWRPHPCARCGKPSVGFHAEQTGALPARGPDGRPLIAANGKPVTNVYLKNAEWRCRGCLEEPR